MRLGHLPPRTCCFLNWVAAIFSLLSLFLVHVGGIGAYNQFSPDPQIGTLGFEWITFYLQGEGPVDTNNYYAFKIFLNRICATNHRNTRGDGYCQGHGILGMFRLSDFAPDDYVRKSDPLDPITGSVDFLPPFVCYVGGAIALTPLVLALPWNFLEVLEHRISNNQRARAFATMTAALSTLIGTAYMTLEVKRLKHNLEQIPEVTHVWMHETPLALTWTSSTVLVLSAVWLWLARFVDLRKPVAVASSRESLDEDSLSLALTAYDEEKDALLTLDGDTILEPREAQKEIS